MPRDATRCCEMLRDAERCREMQSDAKICNEMPRDAAGCRKMPEDTTQALPGSCSIGTAYTPRLTYERRHRRCTYTDSHCRRAVHRHCLVAWQSKRLESRDEVAESDLVKGNYVDVIKKAFSFVLYR